jgi:ABC-type multidrug transport system fused ATPase/permease subunit
MLLRCFRYLRGVRLHVAGGMLLLILAALLEVALPWPVKWLIDSVFGQQPLPAWLAWLAWAPGFGPGEEKGRAALTIASSWSCWASPTRP